jgi:F-type H+-transporting ATPase subunit epsilon
MADTIQLEIVTPEKLVVNTTATEVQIPGKGGELGILPGHAPLITEIAVGEISYRSGGEQKRISVAWGFAEVLPEKVTILAENVARAQAAKQRAEEELRKAGPTGSADAEAALKRASTRLDVAAKAGS